MADSLVLTGVKDIKKHTGTEMVRINPKGGGDTFQLKRWWVEGGVSTTYTNATVFDVTAAAGTVKLAVEASSSVNVRIDHDGSFNFTFFNANELSRAALYTDAFEIIEHYVFPTISGGKIMTVTPAGAASRPTTAPPTLTGVTLAGESDPADGATETYTATPSGTATDVTYVLDSSDSNDVVNGMDITFNGDGARTLTVTASSVSASTSKTGTMNATVPA